MTRRLEFLGLLATLIAIAGVLLNNARLTWCFPVWMLSNSMTLYLHLRGSMSSLALRDAIFLALAVSGWWQWSQ